MDVIPILIPSAARSDVVKLGTSEKDVEEVVLHTKDMMAARNKMIDHVAQTAGMERITPGFQSMSVFLALAS